MNILLTNDDGYKADGLIFLKEYFESKDYNVFVVAPDSEKSGFSHSVTLKDTIRLVYHKDNVWALRGTPADCVNVALLGLVEQKIDIIVSGINHGPNIGKDIIYSGTVGAARQGALQNIPSIAFSVNSWGEEIEFENIKYFLDNYFERLMQKNTGNFLYNVNFPNIHPSLLKGVKQTVPCHHHFYHDKLLCFDSGNNGKYFWIKGDHPIFEKDEKTDADAMKNGYISVTAVKILPEAYEIDLGI